MTFSLFVILVLLLDPLVADMLLLIFLLTIAIHTYLYPGLPLLIAPVLLFSTTLRTGLTRRSRSSCRAGVLPPQVSAPSTQWRRRSLEQSSQEDISCHSCSPRACHQTSMYGLLCRRRTRSSDHRLYLSTSIDPYAYTWRLDVISQTVGVTLHVHFEPSTTPCDMMTFISTLMFTHGCCQACP